MTNPVRDELGTYTIVYKVSDSSNNAVEITRTVHVVDTTPPAIVAIADQVFAENADIGAIDVQVSDLNPQLDVRVDGLPAGLSFDPVSKKITGKSSHI